VTRSVLTAVGGAWESDLVTALEGTAGYAVARRCADVADLLAAAAAGVGEVALVSPELRALDRPALQELAAHGMQVAGVTAPGDDLGERRLRQLGLTTVLRADLPSDELEDALMLSGTPRTLLPPTSSPCPSCPRMRCGTPG